MLQSQGHYIIRSQSHCITLQPSYCPNPWHLTWRWSWPWPLNNLHEIQGQSQGQRSKFKVKGQRSHQGQTLRSQGHYITRSQNHCITLQAYYCRKLRLAPVFSILVPDPWRQFDFKIFAGSLPGASSLNTVQNTFSHLSSQGCCLLAGTWGQACVLSISFGRCSEVVG